MRKVLQSKEIVRVALLNLEESTVILRSILTSFTCTVPAKRLDLHTYTFMGFSLFLTIFHIFVQQY